MKIVPPFLSPIINYIHRQLNAFFNELDHFIFKELASVKEEITLLNTFQLIIFFFAVFKFWKMISWLVLIVVLRWLYLLLRLRKPLNKPVQVHTDTNNE